MIKLKGLRKIQTECLALIQSPETELPLLRANLDALAAPSNALVGVHALSLCQVFKDILPSYRLEESKLQAKLKSVISKQER